MSRYTDMSVMWVPQSLTRLLQKTLISNLKSNYPGNGWTNSKFLTHKCICDIWGTFFLIENILKSSIYSICQGVRRGGYHDKDFYRDARGYRDERDRPFSDDFVCIHFVDLATRKGLPLSIPIKHDSCLSVCLSTFSEATKIPSSMKFWLKVSFGPT